MEIRDLRIGNIIKVKVDIWDIGHNMIYQKKWSYYKVDLLDLDYMGYASIGESPVDSFEGVELSVELLRDKTDIWLDVHINCDDDTLRDNTVYFDTYENKFFYIIKSITDDYIGSYSFIEKEVKYLHDVQNMYYFMNDKKELEVRL